MKIAFLAAANSIHAVRWVNELASRGHEVHLLSLHRPSLRFPMLPAVRLHALWVSAPVGYFVNYMQARLVLSAVRPDLLHAHYASGYGTLARLIGYRPTLLSVWGSDVYVFPYRSRLRRRLLEKNLAASQYLAATGRALRSQAELFLDRPRPIALTPFGIDTGQFERSDVGAPSPEFVVGTVKSLEHVYGVDRLIRAFALFDRNVAGARARKLVIVGEGSERRKLQALAEELGVAHLTEFVGAVAYGDVPATLSHFSVFVALSRSESFGVAVLEASACAVPVIVSDVGGLTEVVVDGVTGFVAPDGNPVEAMRSLSILYSDPGLAQGMGAAGRAFVKRQYEFAENCARMEALYDEIVSGTDKPESPESSPACKPVHDGRVFRR